MFFSDFDSEGYTRERVLQIKCLVYWGFFEKDLSFPCTSISKSASVFFFFFWVGGDVDVIVRVGKLLRKDQENNIDFELVALCF